MEKKKRTIIFSIIIFFIFLLIIWIQDINGYVLNIQAYFDLKIFLVLFWLIVALLFTLVLISDSGFLKIGAMLGLFATIIILFISLVINNSRFEPLKSENHKLVIETVDETTYKDIKVYERQNIFFSKYISSVKAPTYYDISYDIVDDQFVITKCGASTCNTEEIDLNK